MGSASAGLAVTYCVTWCQAGAKGFMWTLRSISPSSTSRRRCYYDPHVREEAAEAQTGTVTCARTHREVMLEPRLDQAGLPLLPPWAPPRRPEDGVRKPRLWTRPVPPAV